MSAIGLYLLNTHTTPEIIGTKNSFLDSAQSMMYQCQNASSREQCYAGLFTIYTKKHSLDDALKTLYALEDIDPTSRGCHFISHSISYAEATKNIKDWEKTLTRVPVGQCTGGFVHGILEAYKNLDKNFVLTADSINSLCEKVRKGTSNGGENSCGHIMGHLLMVDADGDVTKVIPICRKVKNTLLYECFAGAFMENETRENLASHQILPHISWNKETTAQQQKLCEQQTDPIAVQACWKELSHMFAFTNQGNPLIVYDQCNNAPVQKARDDCYGHGIGIIMASSKLTKTNMNKLCTPYENDLQRRLSCMTRAINSALSSTPKYTTRLIDFCESMPGIQEECYKSIGYRLLRIVPEDDKRKSLCQTAPESYREYCQGLGILRDQG
jgi:hypothetical protein